MARSSPPPSQRTWSQGGLGLLCQAWTGWTVAALVGVVALGLWSANRELDHRVDTLIESETAASEEAREARSTLLVKERELAKSGLKVAAVDVARLRATASSYEGSEVLVVWDRDRQEGIVKLASMPAAPGGSDYQLWLAGRQQPALVSAGVVRVEESGEALLPFRPTKPVVEVVQFVLSVEKEGGSPEKEGSVILASE